MTITAFYDDLAEHYHLMFEDWDRSIVRQASILGPLLEQYSGTKAPQVLDCSCGIGTQTLGLALRGHRLIASDLSRSSVARAQREARRLGAEVQFHVADMRGLRLIPSQGFDVVLAADNALPHLLSNDDLDLASRQMFGKLRPGGVVLVSLRDYDRLIETKPTMQAPSFFGEARTRRIVHQVWDWDEGEYDLHLYLSFQASRSWLSKHYVSRYRALLREDLNTAFKKSGFVEIEWLESDMTGYYQPIVVARKPL
ncbi:SAM-dependent methyltransferase [Granulicella aggregans]|uniref:SAM-dependent methyltransferase n=1 Tax=Granulicella aggregans TaxID=474949 RepID=A0A7W8E6X5_9BACT|nr:class I SAM-dependent methyltransferase [Granulicella aggregans]MBB5060814.1 SAM-dependent methyltransferase [Granulicella aggregans]